MGKNLVKRADALHDDMDEKKWKHEVNILLHAMAHIHDYTLQILNLDNNALTTAHELVKEAESIVKRVEEDSDG